MKLYMVIADAYFDGYGAKKVCLGIFDTREKAQGTIEWYINTLREFYEKRKGNAYYEEDEDDEEFNIDEITEEYVAHCELFEIKEIDLNTEYSLCVEEEDAKWGYLTGGIELCDFIE